MPICSGLTLGWRTICCRLATCSAWCAAIKRKIPALVNGRPLAQLDRACAAQAFGNLQEVSHVQVKVELVAQGPCDPRQAMLAGAQIEELVRQRDQRLRHDGRI